MSQIKIKQIDGLQAKLDQIDALILSGSLKSSYAQNNHGFSAGKAISFSNGEWVLADASVSDKLGRIIIESFTDINTFIAVQIGNIIIPGWNLIPGKFYLVDETGNGSLIPFNSTTDPDVAHSNPVLQAITTELAQVIPWRPSLGATPLAQGVEITQTDLIPTQTNGNKSSTGITLTYTPYLNSTVQVYVNGVAVTETYGNFSGDAYFSSDGGVTSNTLEQISAGDTLYWNGNSAGYNIGTGDYIDIIYERSSLD